MIKSFFKELEMVRLEIENYVSVPFEVSNTFGHLFIRFLPTVLY